MKKNRGRRLKLLKGEKMMYGVIVVLIALIPILNVYTSAVVTRTNIEVEELKSNIEKQTQDNESLTMQIDELASLENIQAVAKEYGLSYDNTNILICTHLKI